MAQQLTVDTCARLQDSNNNLILLDCPVVRISEIREFDCSKPLSHVNSGLDLKFLALIEDGSNGPTIEIALPYDSVVNPHGNCGNPSPATLVGMTVKLLKMLRVNLDECAFLTPYYVTIEMHAHSLFRPMQE